MVIDGMSPVTTSEPALGPVGVYVAAWLPGVSTTNSSLPPASGEPPSMVTVTFQLARFGAGA